MNAASPAAVLFTELFRLLYSFALLCLLASSSWYFSFSILLKIFPLADFGISSVKCTPPRSRLWLATLLASLRHRQQGAHNQDPRSRRRPYQSEISFASAGLACSPFLGTT